MSAVCMRLGILGVAREMSLKMTMVSSTFWAADASHHHQWGLQHASKNVGVGRSRGSSGLRADEQYF